MTTKLFPDAGGHTIRLLELSDGRRYPLPPFIDQHGQSYLDASTATARPEDIVLATFPKSGTHWTGAVVKYLLQNTLDHAQLGGKILLEFETPTSLAEKPSPRLLPTHFTSELLSKDFIKKRSKVVYVTRDPRDVAVSFFNHHKQIPVYEYQNGEWNDYFPMFLEGKLDYGSWFDYTKCWESFIKDNPDYPILVISYEEMKKDPARCVKKISEFLGGGHSDAFLEQVTSATSFASMKEKKEKGIGTMVPLRKGETGDWKNWFTESQSDLFNQTFEREMAGTHAYKLYSHRTQTGTETDS